MEEPKKHAVAQTLIPDIVNPSPDYYCTWQTQLYATSDGKPKKQRECISEQALFQREKPYGWAYFYEKARKDLLFVMDDSWDVPLNGDPAYFGSLVLNREKFPSFTGEGISPKDALFALAQKIKAIGWKGLGGWVCAQESPLYPEEAAEEYWIRRLKWSEEAGLCYWKVDWGEKAGDLEFRRFLSKSAHQYAPSVVIENSMIKQVIPFSDTYRTYDVPAILSIPMTMEKLRTFLDIEAPNVPYQGLINCEDEAYIAASLGCVMGIMRHPFAKELPNGQPDPSFPDLHRRLKTKMAEVIRAVHWHKLAPAFGVDRDHTYYSDTVLTDHWDFENQASEIEAWWFDHPVIKESLDGNTIARSACAAISRNLPLPHVTPDEQGELPFVTAAKNPNGAVSLATCGRTKGRSYWIPRCRVEIEVGEADTFGIFGEYKELILSLAPNRTVTKVLAQDLAGECSYDITPLVCFADHKVILSGDLIHKIGTSEQAENDTSEPGLVLKFFA